MTASTASNTNNLPANSSTNTITGPNAIIGPNAITGSQSWAPIGPTGSTGSSGNIGLAGTSFGTHSYNFNYKITFCKKHSITTAQDEKCPQCVDEQIQQRDHKIRQVLGEVSIWEKLFKI